MALPIVGARAEVANMAGFRRDMGEVNRRVTGFAGSMAGAFGGAVRSVRNLGTQMVLMGTRIKRVGTALTFYVTLPLVGLGIAAGRAAIDFESGMAGVRKTTDLTVEELERLRGKILDLSMDQDTYVSGLPNAAQRLAKFAEIAGSMGIEGVENLTEFARTIALLEVTTDILGEEGALNIAKFMSVMGVAPEMVDELGSSIVNLGNNMPTTESQILLMATRIAPVANIMGMNAEQALAWAAAITSAGIRTEMGGGAISRIMMDVQDAVSGTTEKVADYTGAMDDLNYEVDRTEGKLRIAKLQLHDQRDALAQTAVETYGLAGSMEEFIEILETDPERAWALIDQAPVSLGNAYRAFLRTQGSIEGYERSLAGSKTELAELEREHGKVITTGNLDKIAAVAGTTGKAFKKMWEEDASGALQLFVGGLADVVESGGDVNDLLKDLEINNLRDKQTLLALVATYGNLNNALELAEEGYTGVSKVQKEIMDIYPDLTQNIENRNFLMEEAAKRDETTAAQLAKLGNTLRGVAIVLGDVFLPIINDIIAAAIPLVKKITEIEEKWIKWGLAVGIAAAALGPFLAIGGTLLSLLGLLLSPIGLVAGAIAGLAYVWASSFDSIWVAADTAWKWLEKYVFIPLHDTIEYLKVTLLPGFKKDFKDTWDAIVDKASIAWTWLSENIFTPLIEVITTIYNVVLTTWREEWSNTWDTIKTAATTAWESLRDNVFTPLDKAIKELFGGGAEAGIGGITAEFYTFGVVAEEAGGKVATFGGKLGEVRPEIYTFGSVIEGAGGQVATFGGKADTTSSQVESLKETTAKVTESILQAVQNMARQAGQAIDEFAKGFAEGFDFEVFQTNLNGLVSAVNEQLLPAIENIMGSLSELFGPTKEAGEAWRDFGTTIGEGAAQAPSDVETMVISISGFLNGMAASMRGEWSEAAEHFADAIFGPEEGEEVAEGAKNAIYWIGEFSRVMEEKTPTTVELLDAIAKGLLNAFGPDLLKGIQDMGVELGLLGEVFPGLEENLTKFDEAFAGFVTNLWSEWSGFWEDFKGKPIIEIALTTGLILTFGPSLGIALASIVEGIEESWSKFWGETLKGEVVGGFIATGFAITVWGPGLGPILKVVTDALGVDWQAAWDGMKQTVVDTLVGIGVWITENWEEHIQPILDVAGEITGTFEWAYKQIVGESIIPDLVEGVLTEFSTMRSSIVGMLTGVGAEGGGAAGEAAGVSLVGAFVSAATTMEEQSKSTFTSITTEFRTMRKTLTRLLNEFKEFVITDILLVLETKTLQMLDDIYKHASETFRDIRADFKTALIDMRDEIDKTQQAFNTFVDETSLGLGVLIGLTETLREALEGLPDTVTAEILFYFKSRLDRIRSIGSINIDDFSFDQALTASISITNALGRRQVGPKDINMFTGGIVPGPPGTAVPIIAHAGERVIPVSQVNRYGGNVTYQNTYNYRNTFNANYGQMQQYGSFRRDMYRWSILNQGVA